MKSLYQYSKKKQEKTCVSWVIIPQLCSFASLPCFAEFCMNRINSWINTVKLCTLVSSLQQCSKPYQLVSPAPDNKMLYLKSSPNSKEKREKLWNQELNVLRCAWEGNISPRKENGIQKKVFNIISSKVTKVLAIDVRTRKDLKKKKRRNWRLVYRNIKSKWKKYDNLGWVLKGHFILVPLYSLVGRFLSEND